MQLRHLSARIGLPDLLVVLLIAGQGCALALARPQSSYPAVAVSTKPPLVVANAGYRLLVDSDRATIVSLRSTFGVDRDLLIPDHSQLPLLKIELMSERYEFKTITSSEAKQVKVSKSGGQDGPTITIE